MDSGQILLGVLTVACSGVVSGLVTFQLNSRRESRHLRRVKLEAVYLSFSGFIRQFGSYLLPYVSVMQNVISYDDANNINNKSSGNDEKHLGNIEMLIAIYFPSLEEHYKELIKIRDDANVIFHNHKREYKRIGPHISPAVKQMEAIGERLDNLEASFLESVRKEAEIINRKIPGAV